MTVGGSAMTTGEFGVTTYFLVILNLPTCHSELVSESMYE
jgi:hypothetical protein